MLCQTKGPQWANAFKTVCPNLEKIRRSFIVKALKLQDQLMDILLMVSGKVSRSLFHQPSGSKEPGVFVLVGNMPPLNVNFSHLGETSVSAKQLIVVCIDEDEDGKEWQDN